MAEHWQFLFAVFVMYGFLFMLFNLSDGAIVGLPNATAYSPLDTTIDNPTLLDTITEGIGAWATFIIVLFNPVSDYWYLVPINWGIVGTAIFIFIKEIVLPILSIIAEAIPF